MLSLCTIRFPLLQLQLAIILQQFTRNSNQHVVVDAALPCSDDLYCEQMIRPGSYCIIEQDEDGTSTNPTGVCSNPFAQGCLKTLLPEKLKSTDKDVDELRSKIEDYHTIIEGRICNSDDVDDSDRTQCKDPLFKYPEIRVHNGDWYTSIFLSWIYQILFMEILEVPVAIGLGPSGVGHGSDVQDNTYDASFYNPYNSFRYSSQTYSWDALKVANEIGDCNKLKDIAKDNESFNSTKPSLPIASTTPCAHILPEVWNGQRKEISEAIRDGYIDPPEGTGQIGKYSWYIPRYTAMNDGTLTTYYGIQGEKNRHKLAATFKRPLQWKDYCDNISTTNCTVPDTFAKHYPVSDTEKTSYFHDSKYTGYFQISDENNCTKYPTTCTGTIIGPKCSWSVYVDGQLYWNEVVGLKPDGPLKPYGGYPYSSMVEIWKAANATRSNVIMVWWSPDRLIEEFSNTSYEFVRFVLPETNGVCVRARVDSEARCHEDISVRRGVKDGSCGQDMHALTIVYARSLRERTFQQTNLAYRSPAYETIQNIRITDLEMNNVFKRWMEVDIDTYGYDPRVAVCSWVMDNLEDLLSRIPEGYPRKLEIDQSYDVGYRYASIAVACFTSMLVWAALGATYYYRKTRVMVVAQVYFLKTILIGFVMISLAAIVIALQPTNQSCTVSAWLVTLGYTIELVPLLVKIAAINKIMQKAQKMQRAIVSQKKMAQIVIGVVLVVVIYLVIWTKIDPVKVTEVHTITRAANGERGSSPFTLDTTPYVSSNIKCNCKYYTTWATIIFSFQGILLLMASVLAFQSRNVRQEFNESRSLGTLAYSQYVFLLLRTVLVIFDEFYNSSDIYGESALSPTLAATALSFLLSFDTLAAVCIYILPKVRNAALTRHGSTNRDEQKKDYCPSNFNSQQCSTIAEIQRNAAKEYALFAKTNDENRNNDGCIDHKKNNESYNNQNNNHDSLDETLNCLDKNMNLGTPEHLEVIEEGDSEGSVWSLGFKTLMVDDSDDNSDENNDNIDIVDGSEEPHVIQENFHDDNQENPTNNTHSESETKEVGNREDLSARMVDIYDDNTDAENDNIDDRDGNEETVIIQEAFHDKNEQNSTDIKESEN